MIKQQDEPSTRPPLNRDRFKLIFVALLLSVLLLHLTIQHYPTLSTTVETKNKNDVIPSGAFMTKGWHDNETTWRDFDQLQTFNMTMMTWLGSRIERSRQRTSPVLPKVNLIPGKLGQISPSYPVVLLKSPHGIPGSEVCPFVANNDDVTGNSQSNPLSLSNGGLPGYTGWYRPHSPVLNWYRPIHFGSRPLSPERTDAFPNYIVPQSKGGKLQYHGTRKGAPMLRHEIVRPTEGQIPSTILPWTTVVLCPFLECQGNGKNIPGIQSQFYARAYGPSILAGRVTKVPVHLRPTTSLLADARERNNSNHVDSTMIAFEMAFHFRFPGIYTVEAVLEQGDAWPLSKYPRWNSEMSDPDPAYEGWMLPGFPVQVEVVVVDHEQHHNDEHEETTTATKTRIVAGKTINTGRPSQRSWCTMDQLEESHPADQWIITGSMISDDGDGGLVTSTTGTFPRPGPFERYQRGYSTLGICTDFVKESCAILATKHVLWNPSPIPEQHTDKGNILSQCMRHSNTSTNDKNAKMASPKKLNIILIGDSLVRYNSNRLTELLKIDVDPTREVYITYAAEIHSGILYSIPSINQTLMEVATRDEHRVVIFNSGLHDVKDVCVDHPIESITTSAIPREPGDCIDIYRKGMNAFLDLIEGYPADLKIFRSTNAGWMRWGQFGFTWTAMNDELAVFSHHSARILNNVAINLITKRRKLGTSSVRILDYYWPTLARPDNTDVDSAQRQSAGSHLVHPGLDTMRLLARLEVMMILRHFCSEFLDGLSI